MKVLYLNSVCRSGSTGKIAYDLYRQCRAEGHEAAICYGRGKDFEGDNIFKFGLDAETYLHVMLTRVTGWTGCFSPLSTGRLLKFMEEFQPDIIHLHEPHAYFMDLAPFFRYVKEREIPLVYTFHCEFAYTGKCGHAYECNRWQTGCGKCPKLKEYPKTLFFDHTAAMWQEKKKLLLSLKKVIYTTPSQWLADRARRSFLSGADIRVVHNGIDTKTFYPRSYEHLKQKHGLTHEKIVLAVAPDLMRALKGGRWVLKLAAAMQDEPVKFILIGVSDLTEQFPDNVIALGRTENQQELAEYYSMADCFVICSEKETFSMTCAEALCCGTPIAGFKCGAPEMIFEDPFARFVAYGNLTELEELINIQFDIDRTAMSEYGSNKFANGRIFSLYMEIYKELTEKL